MLHRRNKEKAQKNPALALIAPFSYASVCQSVVNTATYLARHGYLVDVFTISDEDDKFPLKIFDEDNIKVYFIKTPIIERLRRVFPRFTYFFDPVLKGFEDAIRFFVAPHRYTFIIAFDQEGLIRARILSKLWCVPYVYHSLEIYEQNMQAPRKEQLKKKLEIWFSQRALFCLSQDEKRCDILAEENKLNRDKLLVVYNSALGSELLPSKDNYLRDKFKINNNKYIVLAVGSLIIEHCIDQIVTSVDEWSDNFVLVLHGWFGSLEYEGLIRHEVELRSERVFLSTDLLEQKYQVFQSSDIGLVFFQHNNKKNYKKNFIYAAGSSGKIFDFMRTGVPIIASDIPGMREIVEGYNRKCGIVINSPKDIGKTLPKIMEEYDLLKQNSFDSYSYYEFGQCYSQVLTQILHKLEIEKNPQSLVESSKPLSIK
ncbi:MAG: hypothetical protein C6Y22_10915 [Hapalosiphonaceae cyanobacterium JJU2]|nr:MAG: hypothetical protein C6Y22_10915 [Hapalosiphonaceae cyanobacterium JJU2]